MTFTPARRLHASVAAPSTKRSFHTLVTVYSLQRGQSTPSLGLVEIWLEGVLDHWEGTKQDLTMN
jgi:hypothetical protein